MRKCLPLHVLLVSALILVMAQGHRAVGQTTVSVSPVTSTVRVSESVTISIAVGSVTNLHAAHTVLTFSNATIQGTAVTNGAFLGSGGASVFFSANPSPAPGVSSFTVDQAILGPGGVSGSGVLFTITFIGAGTGTSPVTISASDLRDVSNNHITATITSGNVVVNPMVTTTSLVSAPNPSMVGQNVTLTATLTPPGATGTVTFYDGVTTLGTGTLSGGTATLDIATLAVGPHPTMTATYGGNASYIGSTSAPYAHTVNAAAYTTSLGSAPNPSFYGQNVTLTATVLPGGAVGSVTFYDGVTTLGTGTLSGGAATLDITTLAVGTHANLTAAYGTSTSPPYSHTVNQASSTTGLTSIPNPSTFGQNVTLTALVTPSTATGTVTFYDGVTTLGSGALSGGVATLDITTLALGPHPALTAAYAGNPNYTGSTSAPYLHTVSSGTVTLQYPVANSWNLISLPLAVADPRKTSVFPTATSFAYAFGVQSGYVRRDTLENGVGYWLKFPSTQNVSITGALQARDSVAVNTGWNLVGSISYPAVADSIIQIPSGIVVTSYYGYTSGYAVADTLQPAKGYWVKVNQNGTLILR
jgi:hypothetical protein